MKSTAIQKAIAVSIILLVIAGTSYWFITRTPAGAIEQGGDVGVEIARKIKDLVKETLGDIKDGLNLDGEITVGNTVVIVSDRKISELAVKEKTFDHTYRWKHKWGPGGLATKELELKGSFRAKAGYDFTGDWADPENPMGIYVSEDGMEIEARIPAAKLLSVEMIDYKVIKDEDSIWNRLTKEDRERAVNALLRGARSEAVEIGILKEADEAFFQQIEDAVRDVAPKGFKIIRP